MRLEKWAAIFICLSLAGCYATKVDVYNSAISMDAAFLPMRCEQEKSSGKKTVFNLSKGPEWRDGENHTYIFANESKDETETINTRIRPIDGNLYVAEMSAKGNFAFMVIEVGDQGLTMVMPTDAQREALLASKNVIVEKTFGGFQIDGKPKDIRSFLEGHASIPLQKIGFCKKNILTAG